MNKISNYIIPFFLTACVTTAGDVEEDLPFEVVSCSHPFSRYEAVVQVDIEDAIPWADIYFEISQGEYFWETRLQTEDQLSWWTEMQLKELDCYSTFEHKIIYGELYE